MARRVPETRVLGRSQGGRPTPPADAHRQADSERALQGALSVPIEQIVPDPGQPRSTIDPERLGELAASVKSEGLLQPLVVREEGFLDDGRTRYVIVAGGRRYAAAQQAGLTRLPVLVRASDEASVRVMQLTENLQREALLPVDEARALAEIMDLEDLDTRGAAARVHRSHTYVADRLKLIKHEEVATAVARGELTPSAATAVAREPDPGQRRQLIEQARIEGLQKRTVQRQRQQTRETAAPPVSLAGGQPTLREVGRSLGATEAQLAAAARARQDAPDLTLAEAIALAMSADGTFPGEGAAVTPAARPEEAIPQVPAPLSRAAVPLLDREPATLSALVVAASGKLAVLRLLRWAAEQDLTLSRLIQDIAALGEEHGSL